MIRDTTEKDIPQIFALIKELAEYEKLSDMVTADEFILKENLFGKRRYAEVILSEYEGNPAGYALYFYNFSTFNGKPGIYLEDLYVRPSFRKKGIGKALFNYLIETAKTKKCGKIEWIVLDWNKSAMEFYKSFDAEPMNGWIVFRLDEEEFKH
jgi:GNAT superfamily N-acetyltransferase